MNAVAAGIVPSAPTQSFDLGHARVLRASGVLLGAGKAMSEDMLTAVWQSVDAAKSAGERPVRSATERFLRALLAALIAEAEAVGIVGVASFDLSDWIVRQDEALRPALTEAARVGWETGALRLDTVLPWDPDDARIVASGEQLLRAAASVPETVRQRAVTVLRAAVSDGLTREDMTTVLRDALSDLPATRAALVSRTTGAGAFNAGQVTAWTEAGVSRHRWLTQRDGEVRASHIAQDGVEVAVGDPFPNGLRFPADPLGPVSEIANCRCDLLPVAVDEVPVGDVPASARSWRSERDARIREDYPALRSAEGQTSAIETLAEREGVSARTVRRVLWE